MSAVLWWMLAIAILVVWAAVAAVLITAAEKKIEPDYTDWTDVLLMGMIAMFITFFWPVLLGLTIIVSPAIGISKLIAKSEQRKVLR